MKIKDFKDQVKKIIVFQREIKDFNQTVKKCIVFSMGN